MHGDNCDRVQVEVGTTGKTWGVVSNDDMGRIFGREDLPVRLSYGGGPTYWERLSSVP